MTFMVAVSASAEAWLRRQAAIRGVNPESFLAALAEHGALDEQLRERRARNDFADRLRRRDRPDDPRGRG